LIHGFSRCRLAWTPEFESTLADDYRLVAMDLRGHGGSGTPRDADADSTLWAADVRAVIEELALDDPVLVGWSYGDLVAVDYLVVHGDDALGGIVPAGTITETGTPDADRFAGEAFVAGL
jgi:pimeloyl-ACP methyl ester carboxylesterase